MAKKKSKPVEKIRLSGRNIYTDKKGRVIFYDMITKKGYLVDKKHENSALFFKNRFVVLLFGATFLTWLQAAVAWAVMMAIAEFAFRRGFLKKLEVVNDVDFERRVSALQYIVENKAKGKVIVLIVLYLLLAVLVILNAYVEKYSVGLCVLSGGIALVGVYFAILHIVALTKMK
jgi:small-conductance mechanosensitive channel